jgi:predicted NAD/FAD-binding protein
LKNVAQQKRLESVQPPVLFCGAWGTFGFHEDAATSGLSVAERLGAPAPFPLSYARWHVPAVRPNRWPRRFFTAVTVGVLAMFASRMWRYFSGPSSSAAEGPAVMLYRLATEQVSRTGLFDAVRGLWRK